MMKNTVSSKLSRKLLIIQTERQQSITFIRAVTYSLLNFLYKTLWTYQIYKSLDFVLIAGITHFCLLLSVWLIAKVMSYGASHHFCGH